MRRSWILSVLLAAAAVVVSCSHDDSSPTSPLGVEADRSGSACRPIPDDFLDDDWAEAAHINVEHRIAHIRHLLKHKQQAQAQTEMFELWDLVLKAYYAGKLPGGTSVRTQKVVLSVGQALYCWVGLDATGLTLSDPSTGDVTQVVFPSATDQDLVHGSGNAGVRIYGSTLTAPVTITITAITTAFNPFMGPLNTPLDQYGPFFHFGVVPDITFPNPVLVEECLVAPVGDLPASVDLAHNVGTGIEILPKASDHLLSCTTIGQGGPGARELWDQGKYGSAIGRLGSEALAIFQPSLAWAGGTGVSGKPKNFSPFGGVDTLVMMDTVSPTTQSAAAGTAVASPPKVRLHTNGTRHASLPGVSVRFAVTAGGGAVTAAGGTAASTTVATTTDSSGSAALGSWVLGTGTNSVSATATFPPAGAATAVAIAPNPIVFGATGLSSGSFGGNWASMAGNPPRKLWLAQAPDGTVTGQLTNRVGCVFNYTGTVTGGTLSMPSSMFVALTGSPILQPDCGGPVGGLTATLSPDLQTLSVSFSNNGAVYLSIALARQALGHTVIVSPAVNSLFVGEATQLVAVVNDVAGNPVAAPAVTWSTSAPSVATVSPTGLVTVVGPGSATITATSGGVSGTATIEQPLPAALTVIDLAPGQIDRSVWAGARGVNGCIDIEQNITYAPSNHGDWSGSLTETYANPSVCLPWIGSGTASLQSAEANGNTLTATGIAVSISGAPEPAGHIEYAIAVDQRSFVLDNRSHYTISGTVTLDWNAATSQDFSRAIIGLVGSGTVTGGTAYLMDVSAGPSSPGSTTYPFSKSGILPAGQYTLNFQALTQLTDCTSCSAHATLNNVVFQLTP